MCLSISIRMQQLLHKNLNINEISYSTKRTQIRADKVICHILRKICGLFIENFALFNQDKLFDSELEIEMVVFKETVIKNLTSVKIAVAKVIPSNQRDFLLIFQGFP